PDPTVTPTPTATATPSPTPSPIPPTPEPTIPPTPTPTPAPTNIPLEDLPLSPASNLRASSGVNSVILQWDAPSQSYIRGYIVERQGEAGIIRLNEYDPVYDTGYVDVGVAPGTYAYRVIAVSAFGVQSDPSDTVDATVGGVAVSLDLPRVRESRRA